MKNKSNRRAFMQQSGALGAILATSTPPAILAEGSPGDRLVVGVIGLQRGRSHVNTYLNLKNVEVGYVCEVDERRLATSAKMVQDRQKTRKVKGVSDMRRIFEDKDVNMVSIATPNFWHTPAAILAIKAGKHVYVEKPGSHNPWEAQLLMAAADKYKRQVQMGVQRRSFPHFREGIQRIHEGVIGEVKYARSYYKAARGGIGKGKPAKPPEWLDWKMWQGPTPEAPFKDNLVHYNWHWHWYYGGGELANNGIHALDIVRWGLQVDYPERVTMNGDRYHYDDDQETPDTSQVTFHCGDRGANWESSSCLARREEPRPFVSFHGTKGTLAFNNSNYTIHDLNGKELENVKGSSSQDPHFQNFADAIRQKAKLNAPIQDGQKGAIWCHLGNIAYRTRSVVEVDTRTGKILNNPDAMDLWKREYRPGWEPTL